MSTVIGPEYRALQNSRFTRKWKKDSQGVWVLEFRFRLYFVDGHYDSWTVNASGGDYFNRWRIGAFTNPAEAFDCAESSAKEDELLRDIDTVVRPSEEELEQ